MSKFIVLDGADGSGTTTQQGRLESYLISKGLQVFCTKNPSNGPYGLQIRKFLSDSELNGRSEIAFQRAMSGLFLSDRKEMQEREVKPNLENGVEVICDRWMYSTLVYQPLNGRVRFEEILEAHRSDEIIAPDLALIFVGDPKILMKRVLSRGVSLEVYEHLEFQRSVNRRYRELDGRLDHNIVYIDADPPVEEVFLQVKSEIDKLYGWRKEERNVA